MPHPRTHGTSTAALVLALLLVGTFSAPVHADEEEAQERPMHTKPYLWAVEGPTRVFLFGTIHVPEPRVLDLPEIVEAAFAASDTVTTELRLDPPALAEANRLSMALSRLPEGKSLKTLLGTDLYQRTSALLPPTVQLANLDDRQPWFVWLLLLQLQLLPYAGNGQALDSVFFQRGSAEGKEVGGIETAAEQLGHFAALSLQEQTKMLEMSVTGYEEAKEEERDLVAELLDLYLGGDENALLEEMNREWKPGDPLGTKLRASLVDGRNVTMAGAILAKMEAQPDRTHFFAVGAGHLGGPKGIVALLEKKGLALRRLRVSDPLPAAVAGAGSEDG